MDMSTMYPIDCCTESVLYYKRLGNVKDFNTFGEQLIVIIFSCLNTRWIMFNERNSLQSFNIIYIKFSIVNVIVP